MTAQEAKDFLVGQAAQQASLDGVSLSDIEKRMMYFTESAEATEDPVALNNAFEAQYNTTEYETKVSRLLSHAFLRAKKENSTTARHWIAAVKTLRRGDHYILVLLNQRLSGERPPYDSLKLFGAALLVILVIVSFVALADRYNFHPGSSGPPTHTTATWVSRLLGAAMVVMYIFFLIQSWILKKRGRK
jgi:hypothetical protein